MSKKTNYFIKLICYIIVIVCITISCKALLNCYEGKDSHPYIMSLIFFLAKAMCTLVNFFRAKPEEIEEIIPIKDLIPNQSTTEITIPKMDYSNNNDYTSAENCNDKPLKPIVYYILIFPSAIDIINVTFSIYAMNLINASVYQFMMMIQIANQYMICYRNKSGKLPKQGMFGYLLCILCIVALLIYYLATKQYRSSVGLVFLLITHTLKAILFIINDAFILNNYQINSVKLNGIEGTFSALIYILLLICMINVKCDNISSSFKEYICNNNSYMEEVSTFFASNRNDNGIKYFYMILFFTGVCIYYSIDNSMRQNEYTTKIIFCIKDIICYVIVWLVFNLIHFERIVPSRSFEFMNISEIVIGLLIFIGLLINNSIFEIKCLKEENIVSMAVNEGNKQSL